MTIPALVFGAGALAGLASALLEEVQVDARVQREAAVQARYVSELVAGTFEAEIRMDEPDKARAALIRAQADRELELIAVVDETDRIAASAQLGSIGRSASETALAAWSGEIARVREGMDLHIVTSQDGSQIATFQPVQLHASGESLLPTRVGVLVMLRDISARRHKRWLAVLVPPAASLAPLALVCLVIAGGLQVSLSARVTHLLDAAKAIGRRSDQPPTALAGSDEFAELSRSLVEAWEELEAADATRRRMLAELDHRVKNNLAMVVAMADRAAATADSVDGYHAALQGKVQALARVHEALAASHWEGASLAGVLERGVVEPAGGADRVEVDVPELLLPPSMATTLGLVFHELLTNALKYGALGSEDGQVRIRGALREGALVLDWKELGGPPVEDAPPGAGRRLIEEIVAYELEGEARVALPPDGAHATLSIPVLP